MGSAGQARTMVSLARQSQASHPLGKIKRVGIQNEKRKEGNKEKHDKAGLVILFFFFFFLAAMQVQEQCMLQMH